MKKSSTLSLLLPLLLAAMASPAAPADSAAGGAAGAGAATAAPAPGSVLVIGAGISGLKAAADLAAKGYSVKVLEARDHPGGRTWTLTTPYGPIEMGAQWLQGLKGHPVAALAKSQGWAVLPSSFDNFDYIEALSETQARPIPPAELAQWEKTFKQLYPAYIGSQQSGPDSAALSDAIARFKAKKGLDARAQQGVDMFVEDEFTQEYAADPSDLSLNWFDTGDANRGGDAIMGQGYQPTAVAYLQSALEAKGGQVLLNKRVTGVDYSSDAGVTVTAAGGETYTAQFAVVTLPLGVLQAGSVAFTPPLPQDKARAISALGMGTLNKVTMAFPQTANWTDANWVARRPFGAADTIWRSWFSLKRVAGRYVIVMFTAGSRALYPAGTTDADLVAGALKALRGAYGASNIPDPLAFWVTRWHEDPYSYGSYSYFRKGCDGTERYALGAPIGRKLYFAGEATSQKWAAQVQGAWFSGEAAAKRAAADNPLPKGG